MESPLDPAIRDAGSVDALAARIGVTRRTIFNWKRHGIPVECVPNVAKATGIAPAALRPDLADMFRAPGAAP